ncbi:maleylpyruvate isomerase family mycothiol-dependent enzyme [Nocardiopsis dassonvillei]|uniref:maleylpyruvate isomerase family mycothiol-dependent enzyme n=1 Tax=Nocardiopsis dassonvillei TaxID=2014 RepID=UPI00362FA71C
MNTAKIYTSCQERMLALADDLSAEQLATPVPALPAWTVRQTYAHLAGLCADVPAERVTPPADDAVTARQVAEREHLDIAALCAAWRADTPALLEVFATRTRARYSLPAIDVWHHENDVRGALGMPAQPEHADELAAFVLGATARAWSPELPGVRVAAADTGQEWAFGERADLEWSATAFELVRAATGRRSAAQIRAMDWSGDPTGVLYRLSAFPFPETDLRV